MGKKLSYKEYESAERRKNYIVVITGLVLFFVVFGVVIAILPSHNQISTGYSLVYSNNFTIPYSTYSNSTTGYSYYTGFKIISLNLSGTYRIEANSNMNNTLYAQNWVVFISMQEPMYYQNGAVFAYTYNPVYEISPVDGQNYTMEFPTGIYNILVYDYNPNMLSLQGSLNFYRLEIR